MFDFLHTKKYKMNMASAKMALSGVFSACDMEPGSIPFDKAVLNNRQNFLSDHIYIIVTSVILIFTFLCPLFFPHSNYVVSSVGNRYAKTLSVTALQVTDDSLIFTFDGPVVDTGSSYMEDLDGNRFEPVSYNRIDNSIVLPCTYVSEYNIYIYDINGKCLHLLLSPRE